MDGSQRCYHLLLGSCEIINDVVISTDIWKGVKEQSVVLFKLLTEIISFFAVLSVPSVTVGTVAGVGVR